MRITAQTPTRISLFGGGTDLAPYCDTYGGITINMAINIYQKVILDDSLSENKLPIGADTLLFDTILKKYDVQTKVKSEFEGIMGAGLGSSASASVALIGAIFHKKIIHSKKLLEYIPRAAWRIEEEDLGWHGGKQDQWAAFYGGMNTYLFGKDTVEVITLHQTWATELSSRILLFYTGGTRKSHEIQKGFKELTFDQIASLDKIKRLTKEAFQCLLEEDFDAFGKLLDRAWQYKKQSNVGITNIRIDTLYFEGIKAGAYGGKILGAGGCGYMIFYCPKDKQKDVIDALKKYQCIHVLYQPDFSGLVVKEV